MTESYRVVLLQRSPYLCPFGRPFARTNSAVVTAASLATVGTKNAIEFSPEMLIVTLSILASYTWHLMPRNVIPNPIFLWSREASELTLNQWYQSKSDQTPHSVLVLFHMTYMNMYACLPSIRLFALQSASRRAESSSEDLRNWARGLNGQAASLHADRILQCAASQDDTLEALHLPLCVYYATLVKWVTALQDSSIQDNQHTIWIGTKSAIQYLETGIKLVSSLRVRMGAILGEVLTDLLNNQRRNM